MSIPFEGDLAYGSDRAQKIDLFKTAKSNAPVVVFIHGGYWHSLDKSDFSYISRSFVEDGLNFAAINYRLAPAVTMQDIVSDVQSALLWLYRNLAKHDCDRERIFVTGSSAGGHLTALSVSTDWEKLGGPRDLIKGGCALSGLYDLEPIRLSYLNKSVKLNVGSADRFSPINTIPSEAPHLLLAVGGDESSEFHRQQETYARAWRNAGLSCEIIEQTDGHHFDMCDRLGDRGSAIYQSVVKMVEAWSVADPERVSGTR